jgi:hypothetical protein
VTAAQRCQAVTAVIFRIILVADPDQRSHRTEDHPRQVGLLELAKQLGDVSQACKLMGYSRDSFLPLQELYDDANSRCPSSRRGQDGPRRILSRCQSPPRRKLPPDRKCEGSVTVTAMAVAVINLTPGIVSKRRLFWLVRCQARSSFSIVLISNRARREPGVPCAPE